MTNLRRFLPVLLLVAMVPGSSGAQETRQELIEQAMNAFDPSVALEYLFPAADPNLAPVDSLWATGVFSLAEALIEMDQSPLASIWLRWVTRHGAAWPIDRVNFRRPVVDAFDEAARAVGSDGSLTNPSVSTSWVWAEEAAPDSDGVIEVSSGEPSVSISATVAGAGDIASGGPRAFPPGTYDLTVRAEGYETLRIAREVLPGVTTRISVALPPLLPSDVEAEAAIQLARITFTRSGQEICTNGWVAGQGLVVTAYSALGGVSRADVETSRGIFRGAEVVESDPAQDLAFLRLGSEDPEPLPAAGGTPRDEYAWSVSYGGCGPRTVERVRLTGEYGAVPGAMALSPTVGLEARGAPVFGRDGSVLGMVAAPDYMIMANNIQRSLNEAIARLQVQSASAGGSGGGKWKWIGGAGAAGALGALLLGGGGGEGGGGGNNQPTTGGIEITIPGGTP